MSSQQMIINNWTTDKFKLLDLIKILILGNLLMTN